MADSSSCMLNFPEYEFWYNAIESDDYRVICTELEEKDEEYRKQLLDGTFNFEFDEKHDDTRTTRVSKVWHLVVSLCSTETIKLFLFKGVNLHSKDGFESNIIHTMISMSEFHPELEDIFMEKYKYIMINITTDEKCELLMSENNEKMRPLEFATHVAATGFTQG